MCRTRLTLAVHYTNNKLNRANAMFDNAIFLLGCGEGQAWRSSHSCPSTGSVIVTTIRFQWSSSVALHPSMLVSEPALPGWTKALLPKAMSLMAEPRNECPRRSLDADGRRRKRRDC